MSRCAIPLLAGLLLGAPVGAAPVPVQPKADDSVPTFASNLLQHRKVQKELKLAAEQRVAISDGLADIEEEFDKKTDELSRVPNPPEDAFDKLDKECKKAIGKFLADAAAKGLDATQRGRLRQLAWRVRGPAAFTDPQVEKKLQLTDAQKKKAAELAERLAGEATKYVENLGNEDDDTRKAALFSSRKDRLKEMVDALTADQKTAWTDMLGDAPKGFVVDDLWLKIELEKEAEAPEPGK